MLKWPSINYYGLVKRKSSKNELVLLKVSGKTYYANKRDKIGELTLKRVMRDSIELEYNNERKFFKKQ